jgi:hypothetical protein
MVVVSPRTIAALNRIRAARTADSLRVASGLTCCGLDAEANLRANQRKCERSELPQIPR